MIVSPISWERGRTVLLQEIYGGQLWSVRPMIVVADTSDCLLLWCPAGTKWKTATTPATRERAQSRAERFVHSLRLRDWVLADFSWSVSNLIMLAPGSWHAVWIGWDERGDGIGWYVNFQRPYARTIRGLQTMDLMLDMLVDRDRRWRWKDEDEFGALRDMGLITDAEEWHIRSDVPAVLQAIEREDGPFQTRWFDWRPDPSWRLPVLPEDWDEL